MRFDIQDLAIIIVEMFCCKIFFETFALVRTAWKKKSIVIVGILTAVVYILSYLLESLFAVKIIILAVLFAVIMTCYLEINAVKAFVLSVLYQSIVLVVDYCGFSLISFLFSDYKNLEEGYLLGGKLIIVFCKICLFLVILLIHRKMQYNTKEYLNDNEWIRFVFFPIFTIGIIIAMIASFPYLQSNEQANILFTMAIGLVVMNILVFYLLNDILLREYQIRSERMFAIEAKNQINMYEQISKNYEEQKKRTHEYKNQILCIQGLLGHEDYEKAKEYIKGISGELEIEHDSFNTNHVIINAILNTKYQEMKKKNIAFVLKINDLSKIWLQDKDLVVILSNMLDNAIEAAEKCAGEKIIKLKFVLEEEIIISVRNTYVEKPIVKDGKYLTRKVEKEIHGIGIHNIVQAVKKYQGYYVIKDEEKEFVFSIMIPRP